MRIVLLPLQTLPLAERFLLAKQLLSDG